MFEIDAEEKDNEKTVEHTSGYYNTSYNYNPGVATYYCVATNTLYYYTVTTTSTGWVSSWTKV